MKTSKRQVWTTAIAAAGLAWMTSVHADGSQAVSMEAESILATDQAAALLAVSAIGESLPAALALELAKFARDLEAGDNAAQVQAVKDELAETVTRTVASLGLNNLPVLDGSALGVPFAAGTRLQTIFDSLGAAHTAVWLAGSLLAPDLAPFLLPHNVRSIATHSRTRTGNTTIGRVFSTVPLLTANVNTGDSFTSRSTLDADLLTVAGVDQALVSDTLVVQVPVATQLDITVTCTASRLVLGIRRCTAFSTSNALTTPDKVLATHPSWRFAYPLNAGQFATRATASDALLTGYDLIGSVHSQVPATGLFASPFASAPGFEALVPGTSLPELGTQAPPVSFYGLQTTTDATLLNTLTNGVLASALGIAGLAPADLRNHPPVAAQGLLGTGLSLPRHRLGVTAGYSAREVRAGRSNFMFVRWHNLGTSTVTDALGNLLGALSPSLVLPEPLVLPLASAPATFYYDVPAGEYLLDDARVDAQGGVLVVDYGVAADAPPVVIPPTLSPGGLLGGLLGGLPGGTP